MECPFCKRIQEGDVVQQNRSAAAILDAFPLSAGHTLIVPLRHEGDFFGLSVDEQEAILDLARAVRDRLMREREIDAFNVGINVGAAAGQTVEHAHLHLIPRSRGDVADPRGGVRWVIPQLAAYWER